MEKPNKPVEDFCFTSATILSPLKKAYGDVENSYTDVNDFSSFYNDAKIVAVPEKYLNVTFDEYYVYNDL